MGDLSTNTQYNTPGSTSLPKSFSRAAEFYKKKAEREATQGPTPSRAAAYYATNPNAQQIPPSGYQPKVNQPLLQPTTPLPKTSEIPSSYTQFKTLTEDQKKFYKDPTDQATFRNWPEALGGGQYITDPSTDPNKGIYSNRSTFNDTINPGIRAKLLGDLPSGSYEVEHNIPLWADGADTMENIGIYDIPTHRQKTAVQAVP